MRARVCTIDIYNIHPNHSSNVSFFVLFTILTSRRTSFSKAEGNMSYRYLANESVCRIRDTRMIGDLPN